MRLTKTIHQLTLNFNIQIGPDKILPRTVNTLLIFGEKITLIDSGVKGCEEEIFSYIKSNGRSTDEIETLILSHSHPDHIGSAARIKELTGCRVLAHPAEQHWIENIDLQEKERPVPGFKSLVDEPVSIDQFLVDGDSLTPAPGTTIEVIHTPGHSAGLLSLLLREDQILFTGDAIPLKNDIPNYDNFIELKQSLRKISEKIYYKTLLTSWTPVRTNQQEINSLIADGENFLNQIDQVVNKAYIGLEDQPFLHCSKAVASLGLPPFLVTPVVDKAFRSHFNQN